VATHALTHYLQTTADASLLDQTIPFLDGPSLAPGQEDAYFTPTQSAEQASVWEHAARTLDASMRRGQHGLPLMGSGDWNDGMNTVGREGRGESVWLGFFLCHIIQRMAPIARQRNELERAMQWETSAALCAQALQSTGWDGQWFRRAFFDNGQALGTEAGTECKIDLIAQAWAVLSAVVPLHMQTQAMDAADALLTDHDAGLLKLLAPPLHSAQPNAGYIQSYPPGVRGKRWPVCTRERVGLDGTSPFTPPGRNPRRRWHTPMRPGVPLLHLSERGAPKCRLSPKIQLRPGALCHGGRCVWR
jgi:cyclic beta-1,2-glucan synthetase